MAGMSDAVDISRIKFASSVFPTPEDRALWESLTPAERLAIVERDEEAGFRSGAALCAAQSSRRITIKNF